MTEFLNLNRSLRVIDGEFVNDAAVKFQPVCVPMKCRHLGSKRLCCNDLYICRETPNTNCILKGEAIAPVRSCSHCDFFDAGDMPELTATVALVIPCHNYAQYLDECLGSIGCKPHQIIVVDDSSDVPVEGATIRVNVRDVHKARAAGFALVTSKFVAFLDADDKLGPGYLQEAVRLLESDPRHVVAYPVLQFFGDAAGPAYGTEHSPAVLTADDIECRNWIPAGSVFRTDVLRQSRAFQIEITGGWTQDWIVARAVLRSGHWSGIKMSTPLMYRKHASNMSAASQSYFVAAQLAKERVTVAILWSGREECWERQKTWLLSQWWPEVHLLILNTSGRTFSFPEWTMDLTVRSLSIGSRGLADAERRDNADVQQQVNLAVAAGYNELVQMLPTEYCFFLEDDVEPLQSDTIARLMESMDAGVAAVSAQYRQRYTADRACAFEHPLNGFHRLKENGVEAVGGTGLGAILVRRSVLRRHPLRADAGFFDVTLSQQVTTSGMTWLLDHSVKCRHWCP